MKKQHILNLLLLTSVSFFTACSNTNPKVDKKLSAYNIMGISEVKIASNSVKEIPLAKTYPIEELYSTPIRQSYNHYSTTTYSDIYEDAPVMDITPLYSPKNHPPKKKKWSPARVGSTTNTIKAEIESSAKRLLGIKYVWGATGPNKYDCSGFTQKIFRDAGINIPRVSRNQAKVGQYVSYKNLIKGDMVFFDTHKKKTGKVTHVGIYLGNGNFIHASSGAKKIVIFNFNSKKFYKRRFLWGRRVIRDNNFRIASR